MKAYTFINSYICGIQVGIQAGHSIVELMTEYRHEPCESYPDPTVQEKVVMDWADDHKTFVWLDGGDAEAMDAAYTLARNSRLPCSFFSEPGLGGYMTAFTVVLPSDLVDTVNLLRNNRDAVYTEGMEGEIFWETDMVLSNECTKREAPLLELIANSRSKSL